MITFDGNAPTVEGDGPGWSVVEVFDKVSVQLKIYYNEDSKGWMESCWDKYNKVKIR